MRRLLSPPRFGRLVLIRVLASLLWAAISLTGGLSCDICGYFFVPVWIIGAVGLLGTASWTLGRQGAPARMALLLGAACTLAPAVVASGFMWAGGDEELQFIASLVLITGVPAAVVGAMVSWVLFKGSSGSLPVASGPPPAPTIRQD